MPFITCILMGGLGNQLFQIFATISYSIMCGYQFRFLNSNSVGGGNMTIRPTYWANLLKKLVPFLMDDMPPVSIVREYRFAFHDLNLFDKSLKGKNIMINGYFQSYKYFQDNYDEIMRVLRFDDMKTVLLSRLYTPPTKQEKATGQYIHMPMSKIELKTNTISMHFRIGDYKKLQQYHPLMPREYYYNALKLATSQPFEQSKPILHVLYFCEDIDYCEVINIINYLVFEFPEIQFHRANNNLADWEQLLLMSCCAHNIIANSSFSWWGAYLNTNIEKMVYYPAVWFGEKNAHNDTNDLCPVSWIKTPITTTKNNNITNITT